MQIKHLSQLAVASCVSAQTLQDILQAQNATLSILNGFIQQQQALFDSITDASDITVLAPNNVALSTLPQPVVDRVENDPNFLAALLRYHVLNGTYYNSNLTATHSPIFIQTLLNSTSYVNVTGGQRIISDINADTGDVSLWSGALNPAKVQAADFNFTGGVIHIIDSMLSMPSNLTNALLTSNLTAAVGALRQSRLASTLDQQHEMTVFAPNNHAFEEIGNLIADMTAADLKSVLGYHIVEGKVLYSDMMTNGRVEGTMEGGAVTFRDEEGELFVNGARVVVADMLISNGVVHVIDGVLNPSNPDSEPNPAAGTQVPAFSGASATGAVPFTTGITPPAATQTGGGPTATITVGPGSVTAGAPMRPAAVVGAAALFAVATVLMNL